MKRQKFAMRVVVISLCCILTTCTAACGKQNTDTSLSPAQMLTLICDSQGYAGDMTVFVSPSEAFSNYIKNTFNVQPEDLSSGAIMYLGGINGDEIVILHLNDDTKIGPSEEAMRRYIERRIDHFTGYVPEVVAMLNRAVVATRGNHVALFICPDPHEAERAFSAAFGPDTVSVPAMQESIKVETVTEDEDSTKEDEGEHIPVNMEYDKDAIVHAYKTGDKKGLSTKNQVILKKASDIIDELIRDGMSDYEKELVIHDWIIDWVAYDVSTIDRDAEDLLNPDSATAFGPLLNQLAICKGYTYTFQLFMDMLDVECITVHGTANADKEEHAWNMVKLDDEWYCVDVTWDDPVASFELDERYRHTYFNVTSQFMRDTQHYWDESLTPEATADKYKWRPAN